MEKNRGCWARIPPRVRREFKAVRDLLGLLVADVGAPIGSIAWCSDAEGGENGLEALKRGRKPLIIDPGGFGVVARSFPREEIKKVARKAETRGCATTPEEQ